MSGSLPPWRVLDSESELADPSDETSSDGVVSWPIVLGALFLISLAVVAVLVIVSGRAPMGSGSEAGLAVEADPTIVVVEVEGAVARPGVYRLSDGSRVGDAIAAAGGYSPRVDAAAAEQDVDLAAILGDGDRVVVPSRDEPTMEGGRPGSTTSTDPAERRVDLNAASQGELEDLPGIGPVTAAKIIAAREERPFRSAQELLDRKVVGKATFDKIRDLVIPTR